MCSVAQSLHSDMLLLHSVIEHEHEVRSIRRQSCCMLVLKNMRKCVSILFKLNFLFIKQKVHKTYETEEISNCFYNIL